MNKTYLKYIKYIIIMLYCVIKVNSDYEQTSKVSSAL